MPQTHLDVTITLHAAERAVQRLGLRTLDAANAGLAAAWHHSVRLPRRHALAMTGARDFDHKHHRCDYRVCGSVMLVCRGRKVITTWRLSWEQVCTVLVWVALGAWPGGEEGSCVAA